jgi:hypothetical protein
LMAPAGVIRPILLAAASNSVNQRLPSGPGVMPYGRLPEVGVEYSVILPTGVIRPTLLTLNSVNQRLPSGPEVMSIGPLLLV